VPTVLTETRRPGDWLKGETETPQFFSRDQITLSNPSGSDIKLLSGTVLGKITASGLFVQHAPGASDGSQNAAAVLLLDTVVPAGGTIAAAAITRDAYISDTQVIFAGGITTPQQAAAVAALAANGVITRRTV
jgi:hypothetical protein